MGAGQDILSTNLSVCLFAMSYPHHKLSRCSCLLSVCNVLSSPPIQLSWVPFVTFYPHHQSNQAEHPAGAKRDVQNIQNCSGPMIHLANLHSDRSNPPIHPLPPHSCIWGHNYQLDDDLVGQLTSPDWTWHKLFPQFFLEGPGLLTVLHRE